MTNADIFNQILSDATGQPVAEVTEMTAALADMFGSRIDLQAEVSDAEAEKLLAALRKELPGIRAWLAQSDLMDDTQRAGGAAHVAHIAAGSDEER